MNENFVALLWWFYLAVGLPQCVRKAFVIWRSLPLHWCEIASLIYMILLMKSCGFINTPWWWCAVCCRRASGSWGVWTRGEMANADFASVGAAVSAGKVTQLQLYFVSIKDLYRRRKSWSIRSSQNFWKGDGSIFSASDSGCQNRGWVRSWQNPWSNQHSIVRGLNEKFRLSSRNLS